LHRRRAVTHREMTRREPGGNFSHFDFRRTIGQPFWTRGHAPGLMGNRAGFSVIRSTGLTG
jgi:hypothetical protein